MFLILLSCGAPLRMFYSELRGEVYHEETRVMESAVKTRSLSHFDTTPACDRQADRRSDGRIYHGSYGILLTRCKKHYICDHISPK